MDWLILLTVGVAAAVALGITAHGSARRTARGSGSLGGGLLGSIDEVFAPSRHEAVLELDRQSALPAPAPLAGDGDRGILDGRISIRLDSERSS
ncbi:MAG: hypothetical protein JWP66_1309 [Naasia sp.]|nr:hypothetical protein [Naasia sp.]